MAELAHPRTISVAELNYYLKEYLAEDEFLHSIAVQGELESFRPHRSGHIYLTLRDGEHSLKAVMFRRYASQLSWQPRNGEMVVAVGSVALYERDATCQLYAELLLPSGAGQIARSRDELRQRLQEEGLFEQSRKKPLPPYAQRVGVITAPDSAAWADIQRIVYSRLPSATLTLYPVLVQGAKAAEEISAALAKADLAGHDVLICGRGGGSEEDLSAFDQEAVVRAIAAAETPLISAVGHESDVSLADLAADVRAATPTHAAQLAVADQATLLGLLGQAEQRLDSALRQILAHCQARLAKAEAAPCLRQPEMLLAAGRADLTAQELRLQTLVQHALAQKQQDLLRAASQLELLSPVSILARGYAVVKTIDGRVLREAASVEAGQQVLIQPQRGSVLARVESVTAESGGIRNGKSEK